MLNILGCFVSFSAFRNLVPVNQIDYALVEIFFILTCNKMYKITNLVTYNRYNVAAINGCKSKDETAENGC